MFYYLRKGIEKGIQKWEYLHFIAYAINIEEANEKFYTILQSAICLLHDKVAMKEW